MNPIEQKQTECLESRSEKVEHLKQHIRSGNYQIDVFRVAQAMLNHVDRGVEKGVELALAFHMRQTSEEESNLNDLLR